MNIFGYYRELVSLVLQNMRVILQSLEELLGWFQEQVFSNSRNYFANIFLITPAMWSSEKDDSLGMSVYFPKSWMAIMALVCSRFDQGLLDDQSTKVVPHNNNWPSLCSTSYGGSFPLKSDFFIEYKNPVAKIPCLLVIGRDSREECQRDQR